MKNFKIFAACLVAFILFVCNQGKAQDSGTLYPSTYGYVWGDPTADTLIQSDTIDYTFRVRGEGVLDLRFGLYVEKVSGTVTSNFIFAGAMADTAAWYQDLDTIALSNVSSGLGGEVNLDDFNYPFLRIRSITTATAQKASYLLEYISRYE